MADQNVRFIRKNGRVIPIRVKGGFKPKRARKPKKMSEAKKLGLQSAGFTIGGILTSLIGGRKVAKKVKRAERTSQISMRFMQEKSNRLPRGAKSVGEGFNLARKQLRRANRIKLGSQVIGGALLSQGVQRALRSQGIEIDNVVVDAGAEIGSQAASALISREANKAFKMKSKIKFKIPMGTRRLAKDLAVKFFKKQTRFKF